MKCLKYIVILFLLLCNTKGWAQEKLRQEVIRDDFPEIVTGLIRSPNKTSSRKPKSSRKAKETRPDTVYAYATKKQHGWFSPSGTLSKEQATHMNLVYRFTCRNAQGNWCKMETLDSYGNYRTEIFSPYILKLGSSDTDSTANSDWVDKLKTACIYEIIADPSGETVVQERAYDESMNIVYIYSRTFIGKDKYGRNQYIGSYKDNYGMPAEMRKDDASVYTYGTLVRLTEDQWGNDSIIEYVDAKGVRKKNSDGVAMEVYCCNGKGELIKQQSRDSLGNLVIDNWGNCGVLYTYNKDHTMASATYMDDKWQPMRMPENRASVSNHATVMQTRYKYDKYKRQIEEAYFLVNGTSDTNKYGVHKKIYTYDEHGNNTKTCYYNKDGNIVNGEENLAYGTYAYDAKGRLLEAHWYDCKGRPRVSENYLSSLKYVYNEDGEKILEELYCANDSAEYLYYKKDVSPQREYTLRNDGTFRIDSLDSKGRTTFIGFYGTDGQLEMTGGRACERYWYKDDGKITVATEIDYDEKGQRVDVDGICETVTKADSIAWTNTKWRYNAAGVLKETFTHRYTPYFETLIGQDDANTFGTVSRSGGSSTVRYYKGEVMRNSKGDFVSIYGRDEFGETDYITGTNVLYCYMKMFPNSDTKYYDEDNNEVEDDDALRDSLPKVMTIEVVDSAAYARGLRDNDVILLYGDYAVNLDATVSYHDFRADWTLRSVLDARKNKHMVVFRIEDASKGKYGLVEIDNLVGTNSELGFLAHIRYLSKKQKARIQQAIEENLNSESPLLSRQDLSKPNNKGGDNYVIMAYPELYREYRNYPYPKRVTDPAILLGACSKAPGIKWTIDNGTDTDDFDAILKTHKSAEQKYPAQHFFLTKDANSLTPLVLTEQYVYTNWLDTYISDEDFAKLSTLYAQAKDSVENLCKSSSSHDKKLVGYWEIQPKENATHPITGYLDFSENGKIDGEIISYYYKQVAGTGNYHIYRRMEIYEGNSYNYDDRWLYLSQKDDSLLCIDFVYGSQGISDLSGFSDEKLGRTFYLNSVEKETFIANDSIVFVKKEKPQYCELWNEEKKDSIYELAFELWLQDEDIKAHHLFHQLAQANYSKAHYYLCRNYLDGYGVEKDMAEAERWERLCRKDTSYTATYYIARKYVKDNNKKKAKEYLGYLRKSNRPKFYNELMSQYILQNGDTLKSLRYLNNYAYYLYAKDDSAKIIKLYEDYTDNYFKRYPKQAADGMAHLAYNIYDMGYYKDAISMFDEARSVKGDVKTDLMDYEPTYYKILRYLSEKYPDDYGEKFRSYMAERAFCVKALKGKNEARAAGLHGIYFLLSYNGWNILSAENVYVEANKAKGEELEKNLVLWDKGKAKAYSFRGTIGVSIELTPVGKEKKAQLEEAYKQYIATDRNQ